VLVREGVPFREAHEAVGKLVHHCVSKGRDPRTLSREELTAFHPAFPGAAGDLVDLERSLESRDGVGGTSRRRVLEALEAAEADCARDESALEERA
jgi:argininosuccinate lyase